MPKTKEERDAMVLKAVTCEADRLEKEIEEFLDGSTTPTRIFNVGGKIPELVRSELKRRYEDAGYVFAYRCNRTVSYIELT